MAMSPSGSHYSRAWSVTERMAGGQAVGWTKVIWRRLRGAANTDRSVRSHVPNIALTHPLDAEPVQSAELVGGDP